MATPQKQTVDHTGRNAGDAFKSRTHGGCSCISDLFKWTLTRMFKPDESQQKSIKTFKDVIGCDAAKSELKEIFQYLKDPAKFTRLGAKLPRGVLLTGPPGSGKTLLAESIAGEAGVPSFNIAGSEFGRKFVGAEARGIQSLFRAAKKKVPCVIFIDDIDAIGNSPQRRMVAMNQLLEEMDSFEFNQGLIVLASTNMPETLDHELTRPGRFDRRVVLSNPDVKERQAILDLHLQGKPLSNLVDTNALACGTPYFSGAELAELVNMAAIKVAVDGTDRVYPCHLEFAKEKLLWRALPKPSKDDQKLIAYHECGHAVVAFHTPGSHTIQEVTILPRGDSLGMVIYLEDDKTNPSKMELLARLDCMMGGRVAEEIIFGADQVTTGASDDLERATALAYLMVSEYGMSDSIGPISVRLESELRSQNTLKNIDEEVVRLLKEVYERVKKLLKKQEADLHSLAGVLLQQKTLSSSQITKILGGEKQAIKEKHIE